MRSLDVLVNLRRTAFLLAGVIAIAARAGNLTFQEQYCTYVGRFDVLPRITDDPETTKLPPSVFQSVDYRLIPAGEAIDKTESYTVYLRNNQLACIGPRFSTIYDVGAGTVTRLDSYKRIYSVISFSAALKELQKSLRNGQRLTVSPAGEALSDTGASSSATDYEFAAFAQSGAEKGEIVARALYRKVQSVPKEWLDYQRLCLEQYGVAYAGLCSAGESTGFGQMEAAASERPGTTVQKVVEWLLPVPMPGGGDAPGFRIVRSVSIVSGWKKEFVDEEHFAVPRSYLSVKPWKPSLKPWQ
jgi:hypothetical protein